MERDRRPGVKWTLQDQTGERLGATSGRRRPGHGFSLVEVLAAMSILAILMLLMGRIFGDSTRAMRSGIRGAESSASARAVMDFMARDVSMAVFGPVGTNAPYLHLRTYNDEDPAGLPAPDNILGLRPDDFRALMFLSPVNNPTNSNPRELKSILYRMRHYQTGSSGYIAHRYELMRGENFDQTNNQRWYRVDNWSDRNTAASTVYGATRNEGKVLIQNVRSFSVAYRTNLVGSAAAITDPAKTRTDVSPLAFLDIRLEILAEPDAIRAAEMWAAGTPSQAALEFVERAVRHHFRRVFFNNQGGYATPGRN